MTIKFISLVAIASGLFACTESEPLNENAKVVFASAETTPVASSDDAADDPAIWIHPENPELSLVLGTDKRRGLAIYNLSGEQVQFIEQGRLNNVDLRQNVPMQNGFMDIAVATNRTSKSLDVFSIDQTGNVSFLDSAQLSFEDPYGICMGLSSEGQAVAFINGKEGEYQQWLLNPDGQIQPELTGSFKLNSQPEGCAVDDETWTLYLGEEEYGVWKMSADYQSSNKMTLLDSVKNASLTADVEGMDIYNSDDKKWLVVSSQGDYSYALYDLNNGDQYLGSIRIADRDDAAIDGVQETDGLAVTSVNMGEGYSSGVLVVQDGFNELPKANQNFKLVNWIEIENALVK